MKNTEINESYPNLSRDYERLEKLLRDGHTIIGFTAVNIDGKPVETHSKIIQMRYDELSESFDIGFCLFEDLLCDFSNTFVSICKTSNIQFFEPKGETINQLTTFISELIGIMTLAMAEEKLLSYDASMKIIEVRKYLEKLN